ncbi:trypsin-like serine protease [Egbenema bharatensis]|uniref:trypsin-like serine protease n=1 Tax=Egbenema bharatensis TaxID=3463334 RepID=UPI003A845022
MVVTVKHPDEYIVPVGKFSGVGLIQSAPKGTQEFQPAATGTLLPTGRHVLTAAHVFSSDGLSDNRNEDFAVTFTLPNRKVTIPVSKTIHYPGAIFNGPDIGILQLAQEAPRGVKRYELYRKDDEVGKVFLKVGYGDTGTGETGATSFDGQKRAGFNRFESTGELFADASIPVPFVPNIEEFGQTRLFFDFDNGKPENDAFGVHFGLNDLGLGDREINTAPGDSGSPAFIDGKIAGVTESGFSDHLLFPSGQTTDVTVADNLTDFLSIVFSEPLEQIINANPKDVTVRPELAGGVSGYPLLSSLSTDSSFGEFSVEARVSSVANWIDEALKFEQANPIRGTSGDDTLRGTRGNDLLLGRGGNDVLVGRAGDDVLLGGRGRNRLQGGSGRNSFWLDRRGFSVIRDFTKGNDVIVFKNFVMADTMLIQRGRNTVIQVGDRIVARLNGIESGSLTVDSSNVLLS